MRFFNIGTSPSGVLVDEASFGYNAYSILETGKDEHGVPFPIVFRAFGDQKLPAYTYLTAVTIKVFGMNNTAIRSVSAISGVLFIIAIYFLLLALGQKKTTAAFSSLIAATAPWGIIISRFGYESNLALLFFTLGLVFFFKAIQTKKHLFFILFGVFFGLTWYSYIAYRMITLLFLGFSFLFLLYKKQVNLKQTSIGLLSFFLILLPIASQSISQSGMARFTQIGILTDQGPLLVIQEKRNYCTTHLPTTICYAIWNKPTVFGALLVERFIQIFSPGYLFLNADAFLTYMNVDDFGQFYVFLLPLYLIGFFALFSNKKIKTSYTPYIISIGMLCAVIPSLLAGEPQKVRLSGLLPFIIVLISFGYAWITEHMHKNAQHVFSLIMWIIVTVFTGMFMVSYLTVHVDKYDMAFNTPVRKLMEYLAKQDKSIKIKIFPTFSDPLMQYAYISAYPPAQYQKNIIWDELESSGFMHAKQLENIEITHDEYNQEPCTLYVTDRKLAVSPQALKYSVTTTNGVHTLLYVYSADTLKWCPK